jgi:hypothetical protein
MRSILDLHFVPPNFIADDAALILNLFPILVDVRKDEDCNPINKRILSK